MINLLGVKIDNFSQGEVLSRVSGFLTAGGQHLVFTPNPEMLVDAQRDWFFCQALNQAELNVADGFGLVLAAKYLYEQKLTRITGVDLMNTICTQAVEHGQSVFLLGGEEGIATKAALVILKKYPGLVIAGSDSGMKFKFQMANDKCQTNTKYLVGMDFDKEENSKLLERIRQAKPDILLVAFGHGKQEKWLAEFIKELPSVKIGMGVGGAFDFLAGKVRRAPKFLQQLGLEWLWRLAQEPFKRSKRIYKAVVTFSLLIRNNKYQNTLPYRQGAIGFVINAEGKFFIAKRQQSKSYYFHDIDHWQPPQGGMDPGETAEQAVLREVKEEIGLENVKIIVSCHESHQYDWSIDFMRKKGRGYHFRGQNKQIFLLRHEGDNSDVKLDNKEFSEYKWVNINEFTRLLHPFRQRSWEILRQEYGDRLN